MSKQETIGFIGIGLMGGPMVRRLLDAGFQVYVWNRTPEKLQAVEGEGALVATNVADLVGKVDYVMLCLTDTAAVEDVVFSEGGVASAGASGKVLIDFSSIEPEATKQFAERLNKSCGMAWIDSPVSGGVPGAEQGTLAIMCGGEADQVDRIRSLLEPLSQRVTHMGPVGSGQVTKVCNQMIVGCNAMVVAEMMALAKSAGVDAEKIPQALKGGFADSIPLQLLGPQMAAEDFEPIKWHVKTLLKDLDTATKLSRENISATPMSGLAAQLMRLHGTQGFMDKDPSTLIKLFDTDRDAKE